ncbi:MAG: preprotein translocase subunit SecY [Methanobacteriota archaeon]
MTEEKEKSALYKLEPLIKRWPGVTKPEGHVHFRTKLGWVSVILLVYLIMGNVFIYGLGDTVDAFAQFRAILAGQSGSIIHLGIGPAVTGSIIMQLFVGAKIIGLDLKKKEDKAIYQGTQKILVVVMIFVEGIPQVFGFLTPDASFEAAVGTDWARTVIVAQLAVGAYLVFLMDEVVSKWGIGSGISLFIAAGVAQGVFTGLFSWIPATEGPLSVQNPPGGMFPKTFFLLDEFSTAELVHGGGFIRLFVGEPTGIGSNYTTNPIASFLTLIAVFIIVVYAQSSRIELPLAHGKVRGARGRYPIKLMYASNIPVIFMAALLANVNLVGLLLWTGPLSDMPFLGHKEWVAGYIPGGTNAVSGFAYYVNTVSGLQEWLLPLLSPAYSLDIAPYYRSNLQILIHVVVYVSVFIAGSIMFGKFWVETASMAPADVAKQIQSSGMQIPGFRRDPRVIEKVLERYIPAVTVFSSAAVGALAAFADILGTVGSVGGTGILLTIGILQQTYEAIAREQVMEMHPVMRGLMGER